MVSINRQFRQAHIQQANLTFFDWSSSSCASVLVKSSSSWSSESIDSACKYKTKLYCIDNVLLLYWPTILYMSVPWMPYMSATNFSNTKNIIFGSKIPFFKYVTDLRLSKLTNEQGTHKIILSSSPFHPTPSSLLVHFSIFSQELWRDPQQGVDRWNWVASNSTIMSSGTVWIKKSNLHFKIYKPILPGEGWRKEEKAK